MKGQGNLKDCLLKDLLELLLISFSNQYIDEDGDVAEEFYEEVISSQGYPWMKRITEHLSWQVHFCFKF